MKKKAVLVLFVLLFAMFFGNVPKASAYTYVIQDSVNGDGTVEFSVKGVATGSTSVYYFNLTVSNVKLSSTENLRLYYYVGSDSVNFGSMNVVTSEKDLNGNYVDIYATAQYSLSSSLGITNFCVNLPTVNSSSSTGTSTIKFYSHSNGFDATPTPTPTPTNTPTPTPTNTPKPTATSTPKPTATSTPKPTATSTPKPTATSTPKPTATSTPTPTPSPVPKPSVYLKAYLDEDNNAVAEYETGGHTPVKSNIALYEMPDREKLKGTLLDQESFVSGSGVMKKSIASGKLYRYKLTYIYVVDGIQRTGYIWSDILEIKDDYVSDGGIYTFRELVDFVWNDLLAVEMNLEGFEFSMKDFFVWLMLAGVLLIFIFKYLFDK